jgi:uncharacterized Zn finger protein
VNCTFSFLSPRQDVGIISKYLITDAPLFPLNCQVVLEPTSRIPRIPDIEKAFKEAGLSLFPERLKDLKTACSCPDWSNPCKHIAAVYYLLAEEFDRDPFLIFKLRGLNREDLVTLLNRPDKKPTRRKAKPKQEPLHKDEEGLTSDISKFWNGESISDDIFGEVRIPPIPAALPKRLGSFPFWRGEEKFLDVMESIYAKASPIGLKVFLGEQLFEEEI